MNQEKFDRIVKDLNEYRGVEQVFLLNSEGEVVYNFGEENLEANEIKELLNAWKEKKSAIIYQKNRFAILKNDELQLAATNISQQKGNIAGSITKDGDYLIVHTSPDTDIILLEWSIMVNKEAWS